MPRFTEQRVLPYSREQLFDLVADIGKYPDFLPWCLAARVTKQDESVVLADLVIGWRLVREKFSSRVTMTRPAELRVDYLDGPMRYMFTNWQFKEAAGGGCQIDFIVDFEFKSRSLQMLMGVFFNEAVRRMVTAFEDRAYRIYGTIK